MDLYIYLYGSVWLFPHSRSPSSSSSPPHFTLVLSPTHSPAPILHASSSPTGHPDPAEALAKLYQRAQQYTDPKKLALAMAGICERTDKPETAQSVLKSACRKFSGSCKVWARHVAHWVQRGDAEEARRTMDRAVQALPKRKHVKFLSQVCMFDGGGVDGGW